MIQQLLLALLVAGMTVVAHAFGTVWTVMPLARIDLLARSRPPWAS